MQIIPVKTALFEENGSLAGFIKDHVPSLDEGDILVVTSKIVALSEGRVVPLKDKGRAMLEEAEETISTPWALLTLAEDGWGINAGADESNADGKLILLPKDPFGTASKLRQKLRKLHGIKNLGILITDTRSTPLRAGTIGRALGYAGFDPLKSYVGKKDLFGRKSRVTVSNHADALAAGAVLVMGEGNERTPIALIKSAPVAFTSKPLSTKSKRLAFPPEKDIFSRIFTRNGRPSHKPSKKK